MTEKEITEKKLSIFEREIYDINSTLNTAIVNLRKQKALRWELLDKLESIADDSLETEANECHNDVS